MIKLLIVLAIAFLIGFFCCLIYQAAAAIDRAEDLDERD